MRTRSIAIPFAAIAGLIVFSLSANGQAVVLNGLVLSAEGAPLRGATVAYAADRGTVTDSSGVFQIELELRATCRLEVRSLGYYPLDTVIQIQPPATYAVFKLREQPYGQPEVVVSSTAQSIFDRSDWLVKDLKVANGRIYALYKQGGRYYVLTASQEGFQSARRSLPTRYDELYESCSGRLYLKNPQGLIELAEEGGTLTLKGQPIKLDDYEQFLEPCVERLGGTYVFRSYSSHNKRLHYFQYDQERQPQLIYEVFDAQAHRVAQSYYDEIIRRYYQYAADAEGNGIDEGMARVNIIEAGEWDGDLIDLILNNELHFAVSYYEHIESKPIEAFHFQLGGHLYIIDPLKSQVFRYGGKPGRGSVMRSPAPFPYASLRKVLVDEPAQRVYLAADRGQLYELEVKGDRILVHNAFELNESWRHKSCLQISSGVLFYLDRSGVGPAGPRIKQINLTKP